jgi:hypothetical protein
MLSSSVFSTSFGKQAPTGSTVKSFPLSSALLSSVQWVFSKTSSNIITPNVNADVLFSQNLYVQGSINPVSDARLKDNILPLTEENFSPLLHLQPMQYTLKKDVNTEREGQLHFGFLAQEVELLYPHLVNHVKYIGDMEDGDIEDGNTEEKNKSIKTLNTLEMIPLLVAKVQELHQEVNLLKKKCNIGLV